MIFALDEIEARVMQVSVSREKLKLLNLLITITAK